MSSSRRTRRRRYRRGFKAIDSLFCELLEPKQLLAADVAVQFSDQVLDTTDPITVSTEGKFEDDAVSGTVVKFETNAPIAENDFYVELTDNTPLTNANFLSYVNSGAYDNSKFHRSVSGFIIEGGRFSAPTVAADQPGSDPVAIPTTGTVQNEPGNPNTRGTIGLAKEGGQPNSGTSGFFFNLSNNDVLNSDNGGYTVFGEVLGSGMTVVDTMAIALTYDATTYYSNTALYDLPLWNINQDNIIRPNDFVKIENADVVTESALFTYQVSSSDSAKLTASFDGNGNLVLTPVGSATGSIDITVTATSKLDNSTASDTFSVQLNEPPPEPPPVLTVIEAFGNIALNRDASGALYAGGTAVTRNSEHLIIDSPLFGDYSPVAAESDAGTNLLLQDKAGSSQVWEFDASWNFTGTRGVFPDHTLASYDLETLFAYDINDDGIVGTPPTLSTTEDAGIPVGQVGTLVSELFNSDAGAVGVAITGTNLQGGTLYYSIDDGTTWLDVGSVSESSARLLYRDGTTRLALSPASNFNGTIIDAITAKAWDGAGGYANGESGIATRISLASNYEVSNREQCVGLALSPDGNTAYVTDRYDFYIVDVSDPSSPVQISSVVLGGTVREHGTITLSNDGNTAYVATSDELYIIDVTDPVNPTETGTLSVSWVGFGHSNFFNMPMELTLSPDGSRIYAVTRYGAVHIVGVSDPTNPILLGLYDDALDHSASLGPGLRLSSNGDTAYLACRGGLDIIDVSDPANPFLLGEFDDSEFHSNQLYGLELSTDGDTAYFLGSGEFLAIDVSDPANPTFRPNRDSRNGANGADFRFWNDVGPSYEAEHSFVMTVDGETVFAAVETLSRSQSFEEKGYIYEIELPADGYPRLINVFELPSGSYDTALSTDNNTLFVTGGIQTVGVTRPGTLQILHLGREFSKASIRANAHVAATNDPPTGSVLISGIAEEGQMLTATNDLTDADGLGEISYQWKRDGLPVLVDGGASNVFDILAVAGGYEINGVRNPPIQVHRGQTYTFNLNVSGHPFYLQTTGSGYQSANIYSDGFSGNGQATGAYEWVVPQDAPAELFYQCEFHPVMSGSILVSDPSGHPENSSYTLTQRDVGAAITVTATYTDNDGTLESVASDATSSVTNVNDLPTGSVTISGTAEEGLVLTASHDLADEDGMTTSTVIYQWSRGGSPVDGATSSAYTLTQADVGVAITVTASYTDDFGQAESVTSSVTPAVTDINYAPTLDELSDIAINEDDPEQAVILTGITAGWGENQHFLVTATSSDVGLIPDPTVTYTSSESTGSLAFTPFADQHGTATITVTVEDGGLDDDLSTPDDNATSSQTFDVTIASINDVPSGGVTVSGIAEEDQILTATNELTDADGLGVISYQWSRDGVEISGATADTYMLVQADVGTAITATASYADNDGTLESVVSSATSTVVNVNDSPLGEVTIDGNPTQNVVLSANTSTIQDEDGLGEFSYQWLRDGVPIIGANSSTHTLTQVDVGTQISVRVDYTDNEGRAESLTSAQTSAVVDVNEAPVLDPSASPQLSATNEDAGVPVGQVGTLVSDLIDAGGTHSNFSDIDGDLPGIAITGTNLQGGTLYYSIDDGGTWSDVGAVSGSSVRVLYADSVTRLAFQPFPDFSGTIADVLTFRAWDRTGAHINGETNVNTAPITSTLVSSTNNFRSFDLSPDGTKAYVSDGTGLRIVDLQDPDGVSLKGYVGEGSNPAENAINSWAQVAVSPDGNTVYATNHDGIKVVDVTTAEAPTILSNSPHNSPLADPFLSWAITPDGDSLVSVTGQALEFFDITDRSSPTFVHRFYTSPSFSGLREIALSGDGNTAFVAHDPHGSEGGSVVAYDITDQSNPQLLSHLSLGIQGDDGVQHVTLSSDSNTAFVSSDTDLFIIDVSNPVIPVLLSSLNLPYNPSSAWEGKLAVSVDKNQLYVAGRDCLNVVDISNLNHPKLLSSNTDLNSKDIAVAPDGSRIFLADVDGVSLNTVVYALESLSVADDTVSVDVIPVNDIPSVDLFDNITINEDASQQTINLSGINAGGGENQQLRITATSSNTDLIPDPSVTYTPSGSTGSLAFTPVADQYGTATITVTVEDGGLDDDLSTPGDNETFSRTFGVTVDPVNDAPLLDVISDITINEDASQQTINLSGINAGGGETQSLRVTATSSDAGLIPDPSVTYTSSGSTGILAFTPVADQHGTATITVTVEDGGLDDDLSTPGDNETFSRTFDVTVEPVNDAPLLDVISDITINEDASQQTINLSGINAGGGETQSLRVTATSSDTDLIPDPSVTYTSSGSTGSLAFTPVADQHGTATITVTVEDGGLDNNLTTLGDNASLSRSFNVTVNPVNDTPTLNIIGDVVVDEDSGEYTVQLSGIADGDSGSQPLRVTATSSGEAATAFDNYSRMPSSFAAVISDAFVAYSSPNNHGSVRFSPEPNMSGNATITVTVEDGGLDNNLDTANDNLSTTRTFNVAVDPVNDVPTLDPISHVTITEDSLEHTVMLTGVSDGEVIEAFEQGIYFDASSSNTSLITTRLPLYGDVAAYIDSPYEPGKWYEWSPEILSWDDAREEASRRGGQLATITSREEKAFLQDWIQYAKVQLPERAGEVDAWIGGYQDTSDPSYQEPHGAWKWVTGEPWDYENWYSLSPNDSQGNENSLSFMFANGAWGDADGQVLRGSIIEYEPDAVMPDPTREPLWLTPQPNQHGTATITVVVEDGGLDINYDTTADNKLITRTFEVTVTPVNDLPTGSVTVTGIAEEDQTLTAANDLADIDGLGVISYQWSRDGVEISSATADTYMLVQADVGTAITATASYTDNDGTLESVVSIATSTVVNVNDSPTGAATIDGEPTQNVVLSANTSTIQDEDGLGEFSYQWLRDGTPIPGANSSTHTLTQVDVGTQISVRVDYTDNEGTAESLTSAQTSAVVNVNDAPVLNTSASPQLSAINEDAGVPVGQVGTLVSDLIDVGGTHSNFSDIDGDLPGIAITGTNLRGGSLWFSNDDGSTWLDVGAVSEASPQLLFADTTTRLYYEPAADFSGSISDVITIRAWDRNVEWTQLGSDIDGESAGDKAGLCLSIADDGAIVAIGARDNNGGADYAGHVRVYQWNGIQWTQIGADIDGVETGRRAGYSVSLSNDGLTLAIGAIGTNSMNNSNGEARIYRWDGSQWNQLGNAIDGDAAIDWFGDSVNLSDDGNTVIIGARHNGGNGYKAGHARVYRWDGLAWNQLGFDIEGEAAGDQAGFKTSISSDGNTVAVGAAWNDGGGDNAGHVRVFRWNGSTWSQVGNDIDGQVAFDYFGNSVSLTGDGNTIAIGADQSYSSDNGYVEVYTLNGSQWIQQGSTIIGETSGDRSGRSVSISKDGSIIAVGARDNGIDGSPGHVLVYRWNDDDWILLGNDIDGEDIGEDFGIGLSLSATGHVIAVGDPGNDGNGEQSGHTRILRLSPALDSLSVDSETISIEVTPVNDSPTLNPISDLVLPEDSLTQFVRLSGVTAGGGETQPLLVTATSSNMSLIRNQSVTSLSEFGNETRLLGFSPVVDQYGIATITVTVEDGGLDLDLDTTEDNATFSQTFDVTVTPDTDDPPSLVTPHGKMFIHETLSGDPLVSYQLPAVNVNGEAINGLLNRITVTSSDTALIPDPTVLYASADVPSFLSFTPVANANGTATLSIQVEDGGPDNDFVTTEDNRQATHQVEVNVLEVISNQNSAILAKDSAENLYVNTQPVVYHEQQAQSTIAGFAAIGASSEDGENALLVERDSVTNRLVTDDAWRINGLFDSLQNESSPVLDLSGREVSVPLNIVAMSGAYEINGVNNPTLIVRRGQTYTFNLNTAGHPFYLQTTGGGYQSANVYSDEFTGNSQTTGEHQWVVPEDAPQEIFYQCELHPEMFGKIIVVG